MYKIIPGLQSAFCTHKVFEISLWEIIEQTAFESSIEQTAKTMYPSHKTITASVMRTNRITSLRKLLQYRGAGTCILFAA